MLIDIQQALFDHYQDYQEWTIEDKKMFEIIINLIFVLRKKFDEINNYFTNYKFRFGYLFSWINEFCYNMVVTTIDDQQNQSNNFKFRVAEVLETTSLARA